MCLIVICQNTQLNDQSMAQKRINCHGQMWLVWAINIDFRFLSIVVEGA
jgi:hypothetical protein